MSAALGDLAGPHDQWSGPRLQCVNAHPGPRSSRPSARRTTGSGTSAQADNRRRHTGVRYPPRTSRSSSGSDTAFTAPYAHTRHCARHPWTTCHDPTSHDTNADPQECTSNTPTTANAGTSTAQSRNPHQHRSWAMSLRRSPGSRILTNAPHSALKGRVAWRPPSQRTLDVRT